MKALIRPDSTGVRRRPSKYDRIAIPRRSDRFSYQFLKSLAVDVWAWLAGRNPDNRDPVSDVEFRVIAGIPEEVR